MKKITSLKNIKDAYTKRILSYLIGKDSLEVFASTPKKLKRLVRQFTNKQLHTPPAKGKWSIAQLISHLCDVEWAMGFRIRMVIAQPGSRLQAYDENKWARRLRYESSDCKKKLELFTQQRNDHVALLCLLSPKEWKQFGMHEERGKETVERMVQMMAGHDINHLRQIKSLRKSLLKERK